MGRQRVAGRGQHSSFPAGADLETWIVIPARLESVRLPQKLLLNATGKPLVQHTYEAASKSRLADAVWVAADDQRLVDAVQGFGGRVVMTGQHHTCGTDRVAEVAADHPYVEMFVNVQGDEPEVDAEDIDRAIRLLRENPSAEMATLAAPILSESQLNDPACVKVVMDRQQRAMYFSRSPLPFARQPVAQLLLQTPPVFFQHVGLYVYRRQWLLEFASLTPSSYELAESLEQLRALQAGKTILVATADRAASGIDTRADYDAFVNRWKNG